MLFHASSVQYPGYVDRGLSFFTILAEQLYFPFLYGTKALEGVTLYINIILFATVAVGSIKNHIKDLKFILEMFDIDAQPNEWKMIS